MQPITLLFSALTLLILSTGCGPKVYESPEAARLTDGHEIIAVLPPVVSIKGRPKDDPEVLAQAAITDRDVFQREMYSWMLRRKQQGRIRVEIQDVESTIAKLTRVGYFDENILTPAELAEELDVDAVVSSRYDMAKPMSEGAAIALGILFGAWGTTNQIKVNMTLHDRGTRSAIWNYDWVANGSTFSSPDALVEGLMRNASRRMPYVVR
ncbi:hypothetical protein CEQ90_01615 [Lewinellaceae bacterium SD302]|nr:hypothetical protein CEQ90_01615 [Lewinellaceae bacterium SD302]